MASRLDVHLASDDERRAAHENAHDIWHMGLPLDAHLRRRETSAMFRRARWVVGCLDGRVVAALAAHPIRFRVRGQSVSGVAIGSVHTHRDYRGRRFAPQVIAWTEAHECRQGGRVAMLFSDIQPDYYARQGYLLCPAHRGMAQVERGRPLPGDDVRLQSCAAPLDWSELNRLYEADYGREAFWVERPTEYWSHLFDRRSADEFFWLVDASGQRLGYARVGIGSEQLTLWDYAVADGADATRERLFRQVVALAGERGLRSVAGWFPDAPAARACFAIEPRPDEITMVKPLDESLPLDAACLAAADRLLEVDHV